MFKTLHLTEVQNVLTCGRITEQVTFCFFFEMPQVIPSGAHLMRAN